MIIICASCSTKFQLDDSRIPAKGAKVRCSRCKHVFQVAPPFQKKDVVAEGIQSSLGPRAEGLKPVPEEELRLPPPWPEREKPPAPEADLSLPPEAFSFKDLEVEEVSHPGEEEAEGKPVRPIRTARGEKRGPTLLLGLIVVLFLMVFGIFYLSTELGSGGRLSRLIESPIKKISDVWKQLWGKEKEGLVPRDLSTYEEKIGGNPHFVIEGRVNNQSGFTKKHIKVRVTIYDQTRSKLAEKEVTCGRPITRAELKALPPDSFKGETALHPRTAEEMLVPSGKSSPFLVVFSDLPSQPKDYNVEIIESPNL